MLMRWKMEREAGLITAVYDKPGSGRVRRRRTLIGCSTERGGCLHRYSDDPALMQVAAAVRAPTRVCACLS